MKLLEAAALLVPQGTATENDLTVDDVWDYLVHDEWEIALDLLEELGDLPAPLPPAFWASLLTAAEEMRLEGSAEWCRRRLREARHGVIRADPTLRPPGETRRRTPMGGAGVLRPMWDIGNRAPTGEPTWNIAALWVEERVFLEPGDRAVVRLAPLDRSRWRHLRPGQVITMYEDRTAVVPEVTRPVGGPGGAPDVGATG
ncbi:hypothetical protein GCM10027160_10170 [Streptomyces calidiresistens]